MLAALGPLEERSTKCLPRSRDELNLIGSREERCSEMCARAAFGRLSDVKVSGPLVLCQCYGVSLRLVQGLAAACLGRDEAGYGCIGAAID